MMLFRLKILLILLFLSTSYIVAKTKRKLQLPKELLSFQESGHDNTLTFLFVHGLGATGNQAKRYQGITSHGAVAHFDFLDAKEKPNRYHRLLVNLGQENDMARLKEIYDALVLHDPRRKIVLVGVSRGAITILNFMALYRPKKVKALVLESPFDTYSSIIDHLLKKHKCHWIPGAKKLGEKIFCMRFPAFKPDGILPINHVEKLPHVPTLFIHSHHDELIPVTCSENLWKKISHRGNVHLVTVQHARHAHLITHDHCREQYENVVHAFLKKYGMPCDATKAAQGKILLH